MKKGISLFIIVVLILIIPIFLKNKEKLSSPSEKSSVQNDEDQANLEDDIVDKYVLEVSKGEQNNSNNSDYLKEMNTLDLFNEPIIVDSHNDTMMKIIDEETWLPVVDIGQDTEFHIDIPKMKAGKLNVSFCGIYFRLLRKTGKSIE